METFNSIEELLINSTKHHGDIEFTEKVLEDYKARSFSKILFEVRQSSGKSIEEVAKSTGKDEEYISWIETAREDEITLKDIILFTKGCGLNLGIVFGKKTKIAEQIDNHIKSLKILFKKLDDICKNDQMMEIASIFKQVESIDILLNGTREKVDSIIRKYRIEEIEEDKQINIEMPSMKETRV